MIERTCIKCGSKAVSLPYYENHKYSNLMFVLVEGHLWWKKYYVWVKCSACEHLCKHYLTKWEAYSYDATMKFKYQ